MKDVYNVVETIVTEFRIRELVFSPFPNGALRNEIY